jgi:hypothetical protein
MSLLLRFLPHLIVVAIVGLLLAIVYGRGVANANARWEAKMAQAEMRWAEERAKADKERADTEAKYRAQENSWRQQLDEKATLYAALEINHQELQRKSTASRNELLNHITRLVKASSATPVTYAAGGNLRGAVETLGLLLAERDGMAEESERTADVLRDQLDLCRSYTQIVSSQRKDSNGQRLSQ